MRALAILVAAGRGERMGGARPKAFLFVGGEPLLLRAARAFDAAPSIGSIVAVVPADDIPAARQLLGSCRTPVAVVAGGARRQDSVLQGLRSAPEGFDGIVLVHDAARPFVDTELIERVVQAAEEQGAAIPVGPVPDTIKRVEAGRVVETLDREKLRAAQTPQAFRASVLRRGYEAASRADLALTDEAMAVEALGVPVAAIPGSPRNRKLTTPEDLLWAEALLQADRR